MKKIIFCISCLFLVSSSTFAGPGTKGGNPVKARFIMAREKVLRILSTPQALEYFNVNQVALMKAKLTVFSSNLESSDCDEIYENKLCWYNSNPKKHRKPLK